MTALAHRGIITDGFLLIGAATAYVAVAFLGSALALAGLTVLAVRGIRKRRR